ncbi:MAG: type I-B CRISPR-associated protein Cas5b [candidate division WOR-3 bacterium]|nr:type I-B CRISPR-associated protein Cas5b [candidate division WOR-3 bacterium]MDH7519336.1 type I-B CRISPR-associated protein Cas5b [bacterium]
MKVLVFDIWGDYAHFRKFYTTTSPLTFSFPPPPTIAGVLGAIYGTTKETNQYLKIFGGDECRIAVRIIKPIKKVRLGLNLVDTKLGWTLKRRTQIRTEFVKAPHYRIYFSHQDQQILKDITASIKEHKTVYTLSLGLSELLANFKFVGEFNGVIKNDNGWVDIFTPITEENLIPKGIEVETGKKYIKEKIPIKMTPERVVEKYDEVIFEPGGQTIKARVKSYCHLDNGENIAFFWDLLPSRGTS